MSKKTAFIGLGVMGYPMAGFLAKAGYKVTVYNRTTKKAEKWIKEYRGEKALTPYEAVKNANFVFSCVGNDDDLRSVTIGTEGAFSGTNRDTVFIDHTTASAKVARELSKEALKRGINFLDAPISGGQAGAENGVLTVMVGGDLEIFRKAEPLIRNYAKMVKLLGPVGYGQLTKMVNQICIAGTVQGLAEGIHFAKSVGLNVEEVISTISKGAAQSWQMENRYRTMTDDKFDYGFAIDWMRKDLKIAIEEAKKNGSPVPITEIIDGYYAEVQEMGGNRWDSSGLIARLKKKK